ncbi:MAG: aminotransferase class I/II-fold pyridoxal phosphate-dependent enzyme [Planctomycetota bacterium]
MNRRITAPPASTLGVHGSLDLRTRASMPAGWVDLAVNTNPFGPAPEVVEAIRAASVAEYPETRARAPEERWAAALGADPDEVLFGAGGVELIWAAIRARTGPHGSLLVVGPTFTEAAHAARAHGAPVVHVVADGSSGWSPRPGAIEEAVRRAPQPVGCAYACTPNSPTGVALPGRVRSELAGALDGDALIVLDESFAALRRGVEVRQDGPERAAIEERTLSVRSLTKDHGIPGVRVGYALGPAADVRDVARQLPPWSVSSAASAAAHAVLDEAPWQWFLRTRARWLAETDEMEAALRAAGHALGGSDAPFLMVDVGDAAAVRQRLMASGVHVRDCASFGLPGHVRVAGRSGQALERLLQGLAAR